MPFYQDLKHCCSDSADWIARRLLALRHDLGVAITNDRKPNSLVIGTWNIRAFDGGIPRLDESFHYIAEILSAFDICAIQELRPDLRPLKKLMRLLGPNWDYFVTDASTHEGGNNERIAFVFNRNRVFFRNLIGEVVISSDELSTGRQIARSPFFAAFQAGWFKFTLCSSHIIYGDDLALRAQEIRAITSALVKRAKVEDQVFIFLGDLNIESPDGEVMQALRDSRMVVPDFPPTNMSGTKYYDQIGFTERGASTRKTRLIRSGVFDWRNAVFGPPLSPVSTEGDPEDVTRLSKSALLEHYEPIVTELRAAHGKDPYTNFSRSYKNWTTFEMSDHLPIWIELETDYSEEYLKRFLSAD